MAAETNAGTLHLNRAIRVPGSVSEQAQAMIAAGCAAAVERIESPEVYPALDDAVGWKALIAEMDERVLGMVGPLASVVDAAYERTLVDGIDVHVVTPAGAGTGDDAPVLYDIHGGALIAGGGAACRAMALAAAARVGLHTWSVDYRMPPDHPYPTPLDDCLTVYKAILTLKPPEKIVVGGGSAGGNLAAALMLRARDEGLPMPAALVLFTPEADLTESGDTFDTNEGIDYVLVRRLTESIALYAGDHDLTHPYLSPLFGDVSGFPPTFIQAGTRDLFLSNAVRLHRKLRDADVDAELHVWEAMPHGGFSGAPEDVEVAMEVRKFLAKHL